MPIWCVLNADGIAKFPALPGIGTVWIAADNDSSGTGQRAARAAAARLSEAGVDVEVITPTRVGGDFNDVVRRYG
jgi:putative DNA primase/helicase